LYVHLNCIVTMYDRKHCRRFVYPTIKYNCLWAANLIWLINALARHELSHLHFSRSGERESDIRHSVRGEEEEEEVVRLKSTDAKGESDSPTADKPAVTPKGILHRFHRLRRGRPNASMPYRYLKRMSLLSSSRFHRTRVVRSAWTSVVSAATSIQRTISPPRWLVDSNDRSEWWESQTNRWSASTSTRTNA